MKISDPARILNTTQHKMVIDMSYSISCRGSGAGSKVKRRQGEHEVDLER